MPTNALTIQVESKIGALYISLFTAFLIGMMFIVMKNFNSDSIILNSSHAEVRSISSTERLLIANWIQDNNIELPEGEGYRYIEKKYPSKPWLKY